MAEINSLYAILELVEKEQLQVNNIALYIMHSQVSLNEQDGIFELPSVNK